MDRDVKQGLDRAKSILLDEENDIDDSFKEAVDHLLAIQDRDALPACLTLLDDTYDLQDLMWMVLHKAERFADPSFVHAYLEVVAELESKASEWSRRIMARCLNDQDSLAAMRASLPRLSNQQKETVVRICDSLVRSNPGQFGARTRMLLT